MKEKQIEEIKECLPEGRTKFYYFKDRYALMLLSYIARGGKTIHEIKKSTYKKLLKKPVVREILKKNGHGVLSPMELNSFWPADYQCYLLTLGKWGNRERWARLYNQTSRPGWNLVLQLNFSSQHNNSYTKLIKPQDVQPFHSDGHPIATNGSQTLAWARIDMDLDRDEALIEEIQTDWIRLALRSRRDFPKFVDNQTDRKRYLPQYIKGLGCDLHNLSSYIESTLQPHMVLWQEAMLASAIWFLREEIGIRTIYYHTFEFGCQLKRITRKKPPRSLYTQLPSRFCFEKTDHGPTFLMEKNNRKMRHLMKNTTQQFYSLVI